MNLTYITENKTLLSKFALSEILQGCEKDTWSLFDITTCTKATRDSTLANCVDVNIWECEETGEWRAVAHPLTLNLFNEFQTDTSVFVQLF